mmetsp:Transcript_4321/g.9804  ORF Transcript_4321/g.9804 Transcript_4321/m.9804 type:complete len:307 (-) Transcript_4321:202-1122(-)
MTVLLGSPMAAPLAPSIFTVAMPITSVKSVLCTCALRISTSVTSAPRKFARCSLARSKVEPVRSLPLRSARLKSEPAKLTETSSAPRIVTRRRSAFSMRAWSIWMPLSSVPAIEAPSRRESVITRPCINAPLKMASVRDKSSSSAASKLASEKSARGKVLAATTVPPEKSAPWKQTSSALPSSVRCARRSNAEVKLARSKTAPAKEASSATASSSSAPVRSAIARSALCSFAPRRLALCRVALCRLTALRSAPSSTASVRSTPSMSARKRSAPRRSARRRNVHPRHVTFMCDHIPVARSQPLDTPL